MELYLLLVVKELARYLYTSVAGIFE